MTIGCFIDYDNIDAVEKAVGIKDLVTVIYSKLEDSFKHQNLRMYVRFYGGWYDTNGQLTRDAIVLSSQIEDTFPFVLTQRAIKGNPHKTICNAEMAYSLLEIPGDILYNTFRHKSVNHTYLRVERGSNLGCSLEGCTADIIYKTIKKKKCTNSSCTKTTSDFLYRNEQKMIDTMISCDLIYGASIYDKVIIVSSDDDFVPVLKTLLNKRKDVELFETKINSDIKTKYNLQITTKNIKI